MKTPRKKRLAGANTSFGTSRQSANLSKGCLVYACSKAEEIRLGKHPGLSGSQVIGFSSLRGRLKHAFVIYRKNGALYAEDDRRFPVRISARPARNANHALRISQEFAARTQWGSSRVRPTGATLIGGLPQKKAT